MKSLIVIIIAFLIPQIGYTQEDWETIELSNLVEIKMPPSMEFQSDEYKNFAEYLLGNHQEAPNKIVLQQKGLNEGITPEFDTYARIILTAEPFNDTPNLDDIHFTRQELDQLSNDFKNEVNQNLLAVKLSQDYPVKLLNWNRLKTKDLSSHKTLNFSYTYSMADFSKIYSENYLLFKNYNRIVVTVEYSMEDSDKWEPDINKAINTIKIK